MKCSTAVVVINHGVGGGDGSLILNKNRPTLPFALGIAEIPRHPCTQKKCQKQFRLGAPLPYFRQLYHFKQFKWTPPPPPPPPILAVPERTAVFFWELFPNLRRT